MSSLYLRSYRSGITIAAAQALREIRHYQRGHGLILPRRPFTRLVREITYNIAPDMNMRFQASAIDALQEGAEAFLVAFFIS